MFPSDVHAMDLIKWGLKCGLKAKVWEEGKCIYALGNTDHLLEIAERIYYPLELSLKGQPQQAESKYYRDGHVVNPARSKDSEFSFNKKHRGTRSEKVVSNLPPVFMGYSSKLNTDNADVNQSWKTYKIPQESSSILREVDRSRLCYYGISEYLNLYNLLNGDKTLQMCVTDRRNYVSGARRDNAMNNEEAQPFMTHGTNARHCNPKRKVIRSMHLYRNTELYNRLAENWASWKCIWRFDQPFDDIRNYFGEEVCLYFHFLQNCIMCMSIPALVSVVAIFLNLGNTFVHHSRKFTFTRIAISITMSITIAFIYRRWLTLQNNLKHLYGISSFENGLTQRLTLSTFKFNRIVSDPVNPVHTLPVAPECGQRSRYLISLGVTAVAVVVAALFVNEDLHEYIFARYEVRTKMEFGLQSLLNGFGLGQALVKALPIRAIMTAVIAQIFNFSYKKLSYALTHFENHQFSESHEGSFIRKLFLFTAFDYFLPLYNLAFVKMNYDPCYDEDPEYGRCLVSLITQMKSIITMALISNMIELGTPFALKWLKAWRLKKKAQKDKAAVRNPDLIDELSRGVYKSTSSDFGEVMLVLMIGCLFSAAWFSLPLLAFVILYVEVRIDAIKLLHLNTRPYPSTGLNIKSWNFILDALMNMTIITNVCVIAFTSFGGALEPKIKLGICFFGILLCVTAKETISSCRCNENLTRIGDGMMPANLLLKRAIALIIAIVQLAQEAWAQEYSWQKRFRDNKRFFENLANGKKNTWRYSRNQGSLWPDMYDDGSDAFRGRSNVRQKIAFFESLNQ